MGVVDEDLEYGSDDEVDVTIDLEDGAIGPAFSILPWIGEVEVEKMSRRLVPNLFDNGHEPQGFAGVLWGLFGGDGSMGIRPLGEGVSVDGFDVLVPVEWMGRRQGELFRGFVRELVVLGGEEGVVVMGWV